MNLYIKLSVCVPRLIPGRGFYAQISSEITSEFPGVTVGLPHDVSRQKAFEFHNKLRIRPPNLDVSPSALQYETIDVMYNELSN